MQSTIAGDLAKSVFQLPSPMSNTASSNDSVSAAPSSSSLSSALTLRDHNTLIPRVELAGRTPDEAFLGQKTDLQVRLRTEHTQARIQRIEANQARTCRACIHQSSEPAM